MENVQKRNLSNPYNTFSTICETFSRREDTERRYGSLLFPSRYAPDISGLAQIIARGLDGRSGPVSIELTTISSKVQRRIDEVVTQMLSSKRRINLATRDGVDQWNAKHGIFYPNSLGELEYVLAMNEGVMVHGGIPDMILISDALSEKYDGFPK